MERFPGVRRVLRLGAARPELEEELAFHFERTVDELVERGLPRAEAEREARRRFGDERRWRRELERIDGSTEARRRWAERGEVAWGSVRYALRRLRGSPGFMLGVVLTFALGIGANATMFGIVDRLLLSPPAHVAEADGIVRLLVDRYNGHTGTRASSPVVTFPDYEEFARAGAFVSVAAVAGGEAGKLTVGKGASALQLRFNQVTGGFFSLLGVRPVAGRFFGPDEDRAGAEGVAVISHGLWQRLYGGSPSVLGRTLDFGYGPYTIVGVAPRGFTGVELSPVEVWLPLRTSAARMNPFCMERNSNWLRIVARLAPGVTPRMAEAEATTRYRAGWADYHDRNLVDPKARVIAAPLIAARGPEPSSESRVAMWLAGISLVVLLIACANVANLLLVRAVRQRREVGIRLALGSSRARVLGQVLAESLLLSLLGGAAAFLLTRWGGALVWGVLLPDVAWEDTGTEMRTAGVLVFLTVLAGIAAGVIPAVQAGRLDVSETLKSGSRTISAPLSRTRGALTVLQAALSVALLVGAGLFVRSLHRVNSLDLGLDPDGVLVVNPEFDPELADGRQAEFYRRAVTRLAAIPGVEAVSPDVSVPFWSSTAVNLSVPGLDSIPTLPSGSPIFHAVGPDYFQVLGLELRRGRGIRLADGEGAQPGVVVNETMARVLWPGQDVVGKCLTIGGYPRGARPTCTEVVGVVEDARSFHLLPEEAMQYYVPLERERDAGSLLVRVRGSAETMTPRIRQALLSLEPGLRFPEIRPLRDLIDPQARSWRLGATMFTVFGVLALVVAGVGLYSVLAFGVAQRTHELGIRSALGATRERLMRMVVGRALGLVGVGVLLGLLGVLAAGSRIEPLLFQVRARDPLVLAAAGGALLLVGVLASWLPALRATRVDPGSALRAE